MSRLILLQILVSVLGLQLRHFVFGDLIVYDSPGNGVHPSDKYDIEVRQGTHRHNLFVYKVSDHRNDEALKSRRTQSWTGFAFTGAPVTVRVTTHAQDFHRCIVRPKSYGYKCNRVGPKTAEFDVTHQLKMMSVEFDYDTGEGYKTDIVDKLFVFADPPEGNTPSPHDNKVLYYGKGVHKLGGLKTVDCHSGIEEIYLAPGAYVHGGFDIQCNDVKLHGRGVLSTEMFPRHSSAIGWATVQGNGKGIVTEGITIADPTKFYYRILKSHAVVRNTKMVGAWTGNNDGVAQGDNGLLEDTFIIADDASVKFHNDNLVIRRLVIWQMQNGGVFLTGYRSESTHHVQISDCDVIHTDWCDFKGKCEHGGTVSGNNAIIDNSGSDHFEISDIHFKDIRVEGSPVRIVRWHFKSTATGKVSDVLVENMTVESQPMHDGLHNDIAGSSHGRIENWKFVNLKIGGKCISNPQTADFVIDHHTADVKFECTNEHGQIIG